MSPRDLVYVEHMLDMARKAVGKAAGLSHGAFDADENLRLALTHLVQVIGEAGRRVSADFSGQHPEIPWQEIVGMRHKVSSVRHFAPTIVWRFCASYGEARGCAGKNRG